MSEEQSRWVGLSDCSWMNIVNHANCYAFHDKEEAVEMAVKLTEAKLKSLNDVARPCPRCAEIAALTTKVAELTETLRITELDRLQQIDRKAQFMRELNDKETELTRAEAVIEKCNLALELNVPLLTTRLAAIFAIAAYREGK